MKLNTASSVILVTFLTGADAFSAGSKFSGAKFGIRNADSSSGMSI